MGPDDPQLDHPQNPNINTAISLSPLDRIIFESIHQNCIQTKMKLTTTLVTGLLATTASASFDKWLRTSPTTTH